jgi:hypothetical protein
MSAKSLERSIYVLAVAIAAVPFALPYFGFYGFQKISVRLSVSFFILALICGGFVSQERRKIEAVSDDSVRLTRERALAKKVGLIGVALAVALPCGYLIGRQF